jgi:hypothetical protein
MLDRRVQVEPMHAYGTRYVTHDVYGAIDFVAYHILKMGHSHTARRAPPAESRRPPEL